MEKLTSQQKNSLKKVLLDIGDSDDKQDMSVMEAGDIQATLERNNADLKDALIKMAMNYQKGFENLQKGLLDGLKSLKITMEDNKPADWSGFFKDMPTLVTQLTESSESTKNTAEVIRNLKWNASQQIRDVNGSPINPSIAPFGVTSTYDQVQLSDYDVDGNVQTVQYFQTGNLKAHLSLTYTAGNLTDVTRIS